MATYQDVNLTLGDTWTLVCTCHEANGALMNVASAEWRLASTTARLYLGTVSSNNIAIGNNGIVTVTILPSDQLTANIAAGSYNHELFVVGSTDSIQITGKAHIANSLRSSFP